MKTEKNMGCTSKVNIKAFLKLLTSFRITTEYERDEPSFCVLKRPGCGRIVTRISLQNLSLLPKNCRLHSGLWFCHNYLPFVFKSNLLS